jgi:hypothetical protein
MGETMSRSARPRSCPRPRRHMWMSHRAAALAALALLGGLCEAAPAHAGSGPSLIVIPSPASGPSLSYFKLSIVHGRLAQAGTIALRNPARTRLRVVLDPVAGNTIDTLGSTYGLAGSAGRGPASWLRLGRRRAPLAPAPTAVVPISVQVPANAAPGDYLGGVSVEQLGQQAKSAIRGGVSTASVVRYAIGVETSIPGPRHPLIQFTGARLEHQPAGLSFRLEARNPGNVILQSVAGRALITRGSRVVARAALGPGTFVTGTSIAYPILTPRERPPEGTVYRVRGYLHYAGGTARLDTLVRFGRAAALSQQVYGGPKAGRSSGLSGWLVAALAVLGVALATLAVAYLYLARRRRAGAGSPVQAIEAALEAARESGEPLSLISISLAANGHAPGKLALLLRSRLRHADRLCRLDAQRFLVVAPDTDQQTADALASDLRRYAGREAGGAAEVEVEVEVEVREARPDASAAELLERISAAKPPVHATVPSD